jgi:hypothetical protein
VDVKALYQCSCGRPHSKWTIFNGIVNDGEALPELKKSRASVAKCQRQLEEERARKEAYESRLAKEYAQRMFDWGKIVLNHNDSMQKFMEVRSGYVFCFLDCKLSTHVPFPFSLLKLYCYLLMSIICP